MYVKSGSLCKISVSNILVWGYLTDIVLLLSMVFSKKNDVRGLLPVVMDTMQLSVQFMTAAFPKFKGIKIILGKTHVWMLSSIIFRTNQQSFGLVAKLPRLCVKKIFARFFITRYIF